MKEKNSYEADYSEFQKFQKHFGFKHQESLDFTPYFVYEIGKATHPYHLNFPEKPYRRRYQNDILNLLCYFGSVEEAIECLEYHYMNFEDKEKFLRYFKFSLPARIQLVSKKDDRIRLQSCLDWIIDIYESYKMEPVYIGARTDIVASDTQKVMAIMKYLLSEVKNKNASETAVVSSHLGIAIALSQFTCFKSYEISTLARKVSSNGLNELVPDDLKQALQKYFFE